MCMGWEALWTVRQCFIVIALCLGLIRWDCSVLAPWKGRQVSRYLVVWQEHVLQHRLSLLGTDYLRGRFGSPRVKH